MKIEFSVVLLSTIDVERQMMLRDIRNQDSVRKWMYSDHLIDVNEHLSWLASLKQSTSQYAFAILDDKGSPVGLVSLSSIDIKNRKADWAFYLAQSERGGLGAAIEFYFLDFVFDALKIEKLNCEVIEGNNAVLKMHKKFLFKEEGVRKFNVIKDGIRKDVVLLGLSKGDWQAGSSSVYERYGSVIEKFSISIDSSFLLQADKNPIDLIEAARAKNNLNWMSILRIALEKSPTIATPIVSEIRKLDKEISALTDDLLDEIHG